MGIFFDTCNALIDLATGRALTGDALAKAQLDPRWPRCGNHVSKRARFCNVCGKPAPGGWWKCPSCGKWVGNDSQYCPHCNQPLYPDDRAAMAGGVWRKEPEHFAQRFEIGDIKRLLQEDLMVQEGTFAVLLDGGKVHSMLESGRHNPDSLAHKINWFGNPPPRSVVLIDKGEIVVPLRIEALRTSEHFPIEFYGEVMLRFKGTTEAAQAFITNILGGEGRNCTFKELSENFIRVVRIAVDELCVSSTLDELVRDPERRIRLQERMTARLTEDLSAAGLELVRVSSAEFTGEEYEKHAEELGKVDIERREIEYRAALRRLADNEAMEQYRDMDTLRTYKETIDHEFRVSHDTREREYELLKRNWSHDDIVYKRLVEIENLEHHHELQMIDLERSLDEQRKRDDYQHDQDAYKREKTVEDAKANTEAKDIADRQEVENSARWLEIKKRKLEMERADKQAAAETRRGMSVFELLADVEDAEARKQIVEAFKLQRSATMSAEQLLAELGQDPVNAKLVSKMEELFKHASEREDKNLSKMLEPAIEAAKHPEQHTMGPIIK